MINTNIIPDLIKETSSNVIVAATKYGDANDIRTLFDLGIKDFGENRVKAFLEKYEELKDVNINWHFIGHLQSKKVKAVINNIDFLHSLDRMSLVEEIQKYRNQPLKCFIEVNIASEISKYGLKTEEVISFYQKVKNYDKIKIIGLMGMASLTDDEQLIESQFSKLVELRQELNQKFNANIQFLSMGMTNDYKIALKLGATHLRLGSILFKKEE